MVDIVIPSHNRRELLQRAIRSVQSQTWTDWRLWVVDDGSEDGTVEELQRRFRQERSQGKINPLRLRSRRGVSAARNFGILRGSGEWLAFLDSDDEWLPHKLEKQMDMARRFPQWPLIHCNEIWLQRGRLSPTKEKA